MRGNRFGAIRGDFVRLFEGDSVAGLGEGELLARFATGRDEAAFEALVTRLGPMVLGVCRRMLADPHDIDDAFQATFLVLVKKAGSIRDRDLVAAWLHGVASKVARRSRADSARRRARERVAMVPEASEDRVGVDSGWLEVRTLIDEEIERLPEDHRRAVVLCDVEGLSREEAALRLGWTLNMVRGRLERARGRLRGRLARRGVAPSGGWLALMVAPPSPSPALLASTVRASLAFSIGRMGTGLASASAVALSQGVLRMMMLSKLKVGLAVLASAGFVVGGSGMLAAQRPGAEIKKAAAAPAPTPTVPPMEEDPFQPRPAADLARARVEAARRLYNAHSASYEAGRIAFSPFADACRGLMQAERDAAANKAARVDAVMAYYNRLKEILMKEQAKLEIGRATEADVAEARAGLLDAEFALAKELETPEAKPAVVETKAGLKPPAANRTRLDQERVAIARRLHDEAKRRYTADEISLFEVLEAEITLAKAEEDAARTKAERVAAAQTQVDRLKQALTATETLVKANQTIQADADRARLRLLDAESHLLDVAGTPDGTADAIAPVPAGNILLPGPGTSGVRKPGGQSPLAEAIASFNAEASMSDHALDPDQDPLTEDGVIAAIRYWNRHHHEAEVESIATTRRLPEGASFRLEPPERYIGGDFVYYGLWVSLSVPVPSRKVIYKVPIREHLSRSLTLEEALAEAIEDARRRITPDDGDFNARLNARIKDLKGWIMEKDDAKAAPSDGRIIPPPF